MIVAVANHFFGKLLPQPFSPLFASNYSLPLRISFNFASPTKRRILTKSR